MSLHPLAAMALDALLSETSSAAPAIVPPRVPVSSAARPVGVVDLASVSTADLRAEQRRIRAELERRAHARRARARRAEIEEAVDAFFRFPADPTFTPEVLP